MTNNIKGIEEGRASYAYRCVEKANKEPSKKSIGEYKAYSKKIPALIKNNGLGATLAFIYSKMEEKQEKTGYAYKLLYDDITEWIRQQNSFELENKDLLNHVVHCSSQKYREITIEVLKLFNWIRRFAEGMLEGNEESEV